MNFCKQKQARIWCVSLAYKGLKLQKNLEALANLDDDTVFVHTKGDWAYFELLYTNVHLYFTDLKQNIADLKICSTLMQAVSICFLAEMRYLKGKPELLIAIYSDILAYYGEIDKFKRLDSIVKSYQQ